MPIFGRTPNECYDKFLDHIRPVVAQVVTSVPLVCTRVSDQDAKRTLEFGEPKAVPLETDVGRLYFYMAQDLVVVPDPEETCRLKTQAYWYRIQEEPTGKALIRWEFDRSDTGRLHARAHVQIQGAVPLKGDHASSHLDLNKLHTPTGWTTIEGVARFLINDLGVAPPCGERWDDVLRASTQAFRDRFTGRGYRPPEASTETNKKPRKRGRR